MVGLTTTEPPWLEAWTARAARAQRQSVVPKNGTTTFGFHLPPHLSRPWELLGEGGGA